MTYCIWRMRHLISMKLFEGHLGLKLSTAEKIDDFIGHVIRQPYRVLFCFLLSKISEVAEQIEAKLYKYNRLSMRNKRLTHMMP